MKIDDQVTALKHQLRNCVGWEADAFQAARVDALNYYLQRQRGDEIDGRSKVVSGDISASVEANLAQISDAFSSDNIVELDPLGPEDEDQAQLESDAVTHFVMKQNPGSQQLKAAIKNALLLRNGWIKVYVDTFTQTKTRTFDNVEPEVADEVAAQQGSEILSYADKTLRVRKTQTYQKFRAYSVNPENMFYPETWDCFELQEIPFIAERHVDTRSDLVRMGFPKSKVKELKAYAGVNTNRPDVRARSPAGVVQSNTPSLDPSQDQIEWFECYWLVDVDGDGIAERRRVAYVWDSEDFLENEPVGLVPYACGAVMIMPGKLTGISQYDKLRQLQDEHTGLKRALYDNINAGTKCRLVVTDKINIDDLTDGRADGIARARSIGIEDVRQHVMPIPVIDNSASVLQNIEALKRERSELGGSALDMQSAQTQLGDIRGSQGVDRAYSVMEQLAAMMTKNIADTLIRNTFLLAHATLRENYNQPVQLKKNGKWQSAVPSQWPMRDRITVRVGKSPGERARQAGALMTLVQSQVQLAQMGMDEVLVNAAGFYRTLMDWARVSDIQNPEQYFVDPMSQQGQQAAQMKAQAAQIQQQKNENLATRAVGVEETKVALEKYKHDSELQYKYWDGVLNSEVEEAKIVGAATTDLLKAREEPVGSEGTSEGAKEQPAP